MNARDAANGTQPYCCVTREVTRKTFWQKRGYTLAYITGCGVRVGPNDKICPACWRPFGYLGMEHSKTTAESAS